MIGNKVAPIPPFVCQRELPAIYDDSLSYYDLLAKLTQWLQDTITLANYIHDNYETKDDLTNVRKLSATGDFTGSWFGIPKPVYAEPGIAGVVDQHDGWLKNSFIGENNYSWSDLVSRLNARVGGRQYILKSDFSGVSTETGIAVSDGVVTMTGDQGLTRKISLDISDYGLTCIQNNLLTLQFTVKSTGLTLGTTNPYFGIKLITTDDTGGTKEYRVLGNQLTASTDIKVPTQPFEWSQFAQTFQAISNMPVSARIEIEITDILGIVQIRRPKLELGAKATDWTLADEEFGQTNENESKSLIEGTECYCFDVQMVNQKVNQGLVISRRPTDKVDEMFTTIVTSEPVDNVMETFSIMRQSIGGELLDSMSITHGGHPTSFFLRRNNGITEIIMRMTKTDANGIMTNDYLVKFPYVAGKTMDVTDSSVTIIKEYTNGEYVNAYGNEQDNLICLRHVKSTGETLEMYTVDGLLNGSQPKYSYDIPASYVAQTLQGQATDGTNVYITYGASGLPTTFVQIDMKLGSITNAVTRYIGQDPSQTYAEDFHESEGMFIYSEPDTGRKCLLTIIATDTVLRRRNKLIALCIDSLPMQFIGMSLQRATGVALLRPDYKAMRLSELIDAGVTKISSITTPAWYYMTTDDATHFTDHPMQNVAGWWLLVSPWSSDLKCCYQRLIRNSQTTPTEFIRTVSPEGTASPWNKISMLPWNSESETVSGTFTTLASLTNPGEFYLTSAQLTGCSDNPIGAYAGWLINSSQSSGGAFYQKVIRNTSSGTPAEFIRVVQSSGTTTSWVQVA